MYFAIDTYTNIDVPAADVALLFNDGQIGLSDSSDSSDLLIFGLTNRTSRIIWFMICPILFFLCDFYFTNHGQNRWIGQILWRHESIFARFGRIYICIFVTFMIFGLTNQMNRTRLIVQFVIQSINILRRFDLFDLLDSIRPIRFDLLCKFSRFGHVAQLFMFWIDSCFHADKSNQ